MKRAILVLIAVLMIVFWQVFFLGRTFYFADNYSLSVPERIFFAESIKNGVFPFWNHYLLSGTPFFADISHAVLYPFTYLFVFLPTAVAVNVDIIFHLLIGGIGVFLLCRSMRQNHIQAMIGSVVWVLSVHLISTLNNLASIQSIAWLPFIVNFTLVTLRTNKKKYKASLIICSAFAVLGGHVYPVLYAFLASIFLVLYWPGQLWGKVKRMFFVPITLIPILFLVLIPFIRLSLSSTRTEMNVSESLNGSLHPALFIEWIIPNAFTHVSNGILWGPRWNGNGVGAVTGYATVYGLIAIILFAVFKKEKSAEEKYFLLLASFVILFAFGKFFPPVVWLFKYVPAMRVFRSPSASLMLWTLCASVLISPSFEMLHTILKKHTKFFVIVGALFAVVSLLYLTQHLWFTPTWLFIDEHIQYKLSTSSFHNLERDTVILHNLLYYLSAVLLFTSMAFFLLSRKKIFWGALFVLVTIDMYTAAQPSILLAPASIYDQQSAQAAFLKSHLNGQYRYISVNGYLPWSGLLSYWDNIAIQPPFAFSRFDANEKKSFTELKNRRDNLVSNWGLPNELPTTVGYSTFVLKSTEKYWVSAATTSASINEIPPVPFDDPRLNDQGVKYILIDKLIYAPQSLLTQYPFLKKADEGASYFIAENTHALPIVRPKDGSNGSVNRVRVSSNQISFHTSGSMTVSIRETYYPGWTCTFDGISCTVQSVKGGMEIQVPEGEHEVMLIFQEKDFQRLLYVTSGSLIVFGLWCFKSFAPKKSIL